MSDYTGPPPPDREGLVQWLQARGLSFEAADRIAPYAEILRAHPDLTARVRAVMDSPVSESPQPGTSTLVDVDAELKLIARDRRFQPVYRAAAWEVGRAYSARAAWWTVAFGVLAIVTGMLTAAGGGLPAGLSPAIGICAAVAACVLVTIFVFTFIRPFTAPDAYLHLPSAAAALTATWTDRKA
ncbi:hypothetical protein [Tsukamurella spumae]|uniref:Uncharacterized protein n=1 Tax=Tsukamurella spumae TaxID=44753 RepID=A0A846X4K6_9ACTN|nr:hypothetical protein [Tsukamurella spumae]NKY19456.1 hypothetical protein [Tsukamurella spumae]